MDALNPEILTTLLADPDPVVHEALTAHILTHGQDALPVLTTIWKHNHDDTIRKHIKTIVRGIYVLESQQGMQQWIEGEHHSLLEGAWLVARIAYPELTFDTLQRQIDSLVQEAWVALADDTLPILNRLNIFNHFFYHTCAFTATDEWFFRSPSNCFIHQVLDTKRGDGLSLGVLYLHLAQAVGLPIQGVYLHGLLLLACTYSDGEVRCYINQKDEGTLVNKHTLIDYMEEHDVVLPHQHYAPCSNIIVIRMLATLTTQVYERANFSELAAHFRSIIP